MNSTCCDSDSTEENDDEIRDILEAIESGQINEKRTVKKEIIPLHEAVQRNLKDIVCLLVEKGADINILDENGNTALHLAILFNHFEMARMILENKIQWNVKIELKNDANKTACKLIRGKIKKSSNWKELQDLIHSYNLKISTSSLSKRSLDDDPGTSKRQKKDSKENVSNYKSSGLKSSLHGTIYQLQMLMLFAHRARNYPQFELATEMDVAEKFDDVAVRYRNKDEDQWTWRFLQAKHKLNTEKNKISINDLTTPTDGDFSLSKYFLSFCKMKANPEFKNTKMEEFALCTNTGINWEEKTNKRKHSDDLIDSARRYNETLSKWKSYFSDENDIEDDKILYFAGKDKVEKIKFDPLLAKDDLSNLFKFNFLKKLDTKKFNEFSAVIEYLKLYRLSDPKLKIKDILHDVEKELGTPNKNKTLIGELSKKILQLKGKIMDNDDYKTLEEVSLNLKKTSAKNKKDLKQSQILDDALHNCEEELKKIIAKIKGSLDKLKQYSDPNSGESQELLQNKSLIDIVQRGLKSYLENIDTISTTTDLSDSINNRGINIYLEKKTKETLKESTSDVNEAKIMIRDDLQKTLTEIDILQVLLDEKRFESNLQEFIESFRIIINYPNVEELNTYLCNMLGNDFELLNADLATNSFQEDILKWLRVYKNRRSKFLTKNNVNNFIEDIKTKLHSLMASGLSMAYPEKLKTYQLHFTGNYKYNFLGNVQCLILVTNLTRLAAINVLQTLEESGDYMTSDSFIFVRIRTVLQQPITRKLLFESFNSENSHPLSVIECQSKTIIIPNQLRLIFNDLNNILKLHPEKKLIIICNEQFSNNIINNLATYQVENIVIKFSNLNESSKKKLLDKQCNFQGKNVNLNKLINYETANEILDEENLQIIVEDDKIEIGEVEFFSFNDNIQEYYIERKLHLQTVKNDVLTTKENTELYLITGITDTHLIQLGANANRINKYDENEEYSIGIIWCDPSEDPEYIYEKICKITTQNFHWLEHKNDTLYWKTSTGNYTILYNYLNSEYTDVQNFFHENDFTNATDKVVIIANDSGVGKSTFLTSLAGKSKNHSWILRIDLNDFAFNKDNLPDRDKRKQMKCLKDITFNQNDVEKAVDFITEIVTRSKPSGKFEKDLLKYSLKENSSLSRIMILFDGFDEISPTYSNQTITLIKALKRSNAAQIYVTTRIHEKNLLEQELQTSAFVLKHLDEPEQIKFMCKFWKFSIKFVGENDIQIIMNYLNNIKQQFGEEITQIIDNQPLEIDALRSRIDSINFENFALKLLYKWNIKINKHDTTFNVVPLHLRMLAEIIFHEKFQLIENFHILDLYKKFVKIKYDIFYNLKKNLGNTVAAEGIRETHSSTLKKKMHIISVQSLFPDFNVLDLNETQKELDKLSKENEKMKLARTGLLILKGSRLDFVHRSFAGYFLSKYAVKKFSFEKMQVLLFEKILLENGYNFIREFFNSQLERKEGFLKDIEITERASKAIQIIYGRDNILHVIVQENYINCVKFLLEKIEKFPQVLENILLTIGKYTPIIDELVYNPRNTFQPNPEYFKILINKTKKHYNVLEKVINQCHETHGLILVGTQTSFTIVEKMIACRKINLLQIFLEEVKDDPRFLETTISGSKNGLLNLAVSRTELKDFAIVLDILYDSFQDFLGKLLLQKKQQRSDTALHTLAYKKQMNFLKRFLKWLNKIKGNHNNIIEIEKLITATNLDGRYKLTPLEVAVYTNAPQNALLLLTFIKKNFTETLFKDITSNNPNKNILFNCLIQGKTQSSQDLLKWFHRNVNSSTFRKMLLTRSICNRSALEVICARNFRTTLEVLLNFLNQQSKKKEADESEAADESGKTDELEETDESEAADESESADESKAADDNTDLKKVLIELIISKESEKSALIETLIWKNDDTAKSFLNFLSKNIEREVKKEIIYKVNRFGDGVLNYAAEKGTSEGLKMLLQFILDELGREILRDLLLKGDNYGNTALHDAVSRSFEDGCDTTRALLDFIQDNLDIETLKTVVFNSNNYGTTALNCVKQEFFQCLEEKIEFIISKIINDSQIINFNKIECNTLKYYVENHNKRENKAEIIKLIDNMILQCTRNPNENGTNRESMENVSLPT